MNPEWLTGLILFSRAILFGTALGLYYGLFRLIRLLFPHPGWLVALEDLLFFLPATAAHVLFHFMYGEGETRWFSVLGVALGFLAYLASVGKWLQKLCRFLRDLILQKIFRPLKRRIAARREQIRRKRSAKKEIRRRKKEEAALLREKQRAEKRAAREKKRAAKEK